jgi:maleate isomerase
MPERILLGMLTPSSNTRLEPITAAMLAEIPEASAHFGRFRVTEIALSDAALAQFDDREILRAAVLLADAKVQAIGWNGTSAGCGSITSVLSPDHGGDWHSAPPSSP